MRRIAMFSSVRPRADETSAAMPGDDVVPRADVVMDRAFTVPGTPAEVWPWVAQLGKGRAGWYFSRRVERLIPRGRRALRRVEARWQELGPGDVIPDYGGPHETFEVVTAEPPTTLVYRSTRGRMNVSWAIALAEAPEASTRIRLRLRLAPVRRRWLATTAGELVDMVTIAGLRAGLHERMSAGRS